jgi:cytosine/adenosine deaminase-related metal-dependent hydrolase/SAM-dependent methyltransferase
VGISVATSIGVREAYELWAPDYARGPSPLLALQERCLEPLIPPLRGRRLVDVACGTGRWLKRLSSRGPRFAVGVDLSEAMLRRAQDEVPGALLCADGGALPLRERCADMVLCSLALDHVSNLAAFIYELARIIEDRGVLLLSDFHPDAHARGWKRSFKATAGIIDLQVYPRPLTTIHDALRHAGFSLDVCEEPSFGEPDRAAFHDAGREDLFEPAVHAGPTLYVARYVRRTRTTADQHGDVALHSAAVARSAHSVKRAHVSIGSGVVTSVSSSATADAKFDLCGYMLLPGLINAHDHLEFSLFPRLGKGSYPSAREWAKDIYRPDEYPIREHRRVPKDVRLWWGALKNLLCGVTTVSHHNPFADAFRDPDFPVRVVEHFGWAHSFAEEPDVHARFRATPAGSPFLIHLGEGTDSEAESEFARLVDIGALDQRTVIVHGVALSGADHDRLQRCGGALVWCPSSNLNLLGRTVSPEILGRSSRVAMGSDSSISGAGDLLDEIPIARACGVRPDRLYDMVTGLGANLLHDGAGAIAAGLPADVIAIRDRGLSPSESLCRATHADIELVLVGGRLRLISEELLERWPGPVPKIFEPIVMKGVKRFVAAPVSRLLNIARQELGPEIRLGGKRVWQ